MRYAGFTKRFPASIIDALITIPVIILMFMFSNKSFVLFVIFQIIVFLFGLYCNVYLLKIYGGSPGKLFAGIKVVKVNGDSIGWKEALLRNVADYIFSFLLIGLTIFYIYNSDINWGHISYANLVLNYGNTRLFKIISNIQTIWIWGELLIILTNNKKRSLHDFIAGTVVIYNQKKQILDIKKTSSDLDLKST